jgi:membrane-anchored glycerophosphoryl diester phosphodiesterase (GDPDase)
MSNHTFSPPEAIKFGWHTVKKDLFFFAGITLLFFLVGRLPSFFDREHQAGFQLAAQLVSWIIQAGMTFGMISIMLKAVDGKKYSFNDLFAHFKLELIMKSFAVGVLIFLSVVIGLVLLVIPGIYVGIRLSFAYYFLLEKNAGPIEALKLSWKMTDKRVVKLLEYWVYAVGVLLVGLVAVLIGLLVAQPLLALGYAYIYRKISAK